MNRTRKLKRDNKLYIGLFYMLNGILVFIFASLGLLRVYLFVLCGLLSVVIPVNLVFVIRTKNPGYLVTALHYSVLALAFWSAARHNESLAKTFLLFFWFTFFCMLYIGITRQVKWRREEMLELAAKPVRECQNGFTGRPYPLGKASYSKDELRQFSKFLLRRLIAVPYVEHDRVVLAITGHYIDHILKIRKDYSRDTRVVFDYNGSISVHIIKDDYTRYKDELSFDRLCESLGNLFKEFLELHKKGEEVRIMDRLNELKLFPFTGGLIGF